MNAFVEHHKNSIQFGYRCFDRILLNGLIQPFQLSHRANFGNICGTTARKPTVYVLEQSRTRLPIMKSILS
jgi:hypothetical protein